MEKLVEGLGKDVTGGQLYTGQRGFIVGKTAVLVGELCWAFTLDYGGLFKRELASARCDPTTTPPSKIILLRQENVIDLYNESWQIEIKRGLIDAPSLKFICVVVKLLFDRGIVRGETNAKTLDKGVDKPPYPNVLYNQSQRSVASGLSMKSNIMSL